MLNSIIVGTLSGGAVYGLVAMGFVITYRTTRVLSFAQGGFMVIGAFIFKSLAQADFGLAPSLLLSMLALFAVGALTYWVAFGRIVGSEPFITAMATIGLGTVLYAIAVMIWGSSPLALPPLLSYKQIEFLGFAILPVDLFAIGVAVTLFALLVGCLQWTKMGLRMRAVADLPQLAGYVGIKVNRISMLAWGIAGASAAAGGVVFALSAAPDAAGIYALGLIVFPVILLGGFDSIVGAAVGGLAIALLQNLVITYLGGQYQDVAAYGALFVILVLRPQGLFGSREISRL